MSDLAWAGASEIAGQWWLLMRRQAYNPDHAGEHRLWLSIGGRVGHSSLHALDIHEGRRTDPGGRRWEVAVFSADDDGGMSRPPSGKPEMQAVKPGGNSNWTPTECDCCGCRQGRPRNKEWFTRARGNPASAL